MLQLFFLGFGFSTGFNPPLDIHLPSSDEVSEMVIEEYGDLSDDSPRIEIENENGDKELVKIS